MVTDLDETHPFTERIRDASFIEWDEAHDLLTSALNVIEALMDDQDFAFRDMDFLMCLWCNVADRGNNEHAPNCAWVRAKHFLATGELG